jgi:hypothetical protein
VDIALRVKPDVTYRFTLEIQVVSKVRLFGGSWNVLRGINRANGVPRASFAQKIVYSNDMIQVVTQNLRRDEFVSFLLEMTLAVLLMQGVGDVFNLCCVFASECL